MIELVQTEQDLVDYMVVMSFWSMMAFTILSIMAIFEIIIPLEIFEIASIGAILSCLTFVYYMIQSNHLIEKEETE